MTEKTNMESAPNEGAVEPTTVSPVSGQQSSAGATGEVNVQEFAKRLEKLERMEQSAKDRAIANLQKQLDEISGKTVVKEETPPTAVKVDTGTISGAQALPEALERFRESGLSVSDPDVSALIGKANDFKTRESFLLEAERLVNRKSIKPSVTASAAIATSTGTPPGNPSIEALTAEYKTKFIAAHGNKAECERIKSEYAKKGVLVDKVAFTIA